MAFVALMPPEIAATCPRLPVFFKVYLITEKYAKTASTQNQLFVCPVKCIVASNTLSLFKSIDLPRLAFYTAVHLRKVKSVLVW